MIRVEAVWLCTEPMDMRAGTDTTLARVVQVFGAARPHHAYVFEQGTVIRSGSGQELLQDAFVQKAFLGV